MTSAKRNSHALKFYSDVLGLEHLHYGIWHESDALTLANLKAAQERYQRAIIELLPAQDAAWPVPDYVEGGGCTGGTAWAGMPSPTR